MEPAELIADHPVPLAIRVVAHSQVGVHGFGVVVSRPARPIRTSVIAVPLLLDVAGEIGDGELGTNSLGEMVDCAIGEGFDRVAEHLKVVVGRSLRAQALPGVERIDERPGIVL